MEFILHFIHSLLTLEEGRVWAVPPVIQSKTESTIEGPNGYSEQYILLSNKISESEA